MSAKRVDKLERITSISEFSSTFRLFKLLFNSNTLIGSIKSVEPLADVSCSNPFTSLRYSCFTGITKRLFLIVIIGSCIYLLFKNELRVLRISCSVFLSFLRIL